MCPVENLLFQRVQRVRVQRVCLVIQCKLLKTAFWHWQVPAHFCVFICVNLLNIGQQNSVIWKAVIDFLGFPKKNLIWALKSAHIGEQDSGFFSKSIYRLSASELAPHWISRYGNDHFRFSYKSFFDLFHRKFAIFWCFNWESQVPTLCLQIIVIFRAPTFQHVIFLGHLFFNMEEWQAGMFKNTI